MLNSFSQEKLIIHEVYKNQHEFDDNSKISSVLEDFEKLDFEKNPCNDSFDVINYNEGKEANPFDKIARYYGRKQDIFLFISILRDKKQSEKIIDIISKKCDDQAKEKFIERMNIYLGRISQGEHDVREFLNSDDLVAFFNGYHVACPGHDRNIHENLNINITKPGQSLEISSLFSRRIKRMEEEKSEVKRAKIYSNGKRIVTIKKNEKQQRDYSFTEIAIYDIEISWGAKDESGKDLNCAVVLSINSGQIGIKKPVIDGKDVETKDILELAKQNKAVLIKGKALHEILGAQQTPCEEKKERVNIVVPDFSVPSSTFNELKADPLHEGWDVSETANESVQKYARIKELEAEINKQQQTISKLTDENQNVNKIIERDNRDLRAQVTELKVDLSTQKDCVNHFQEGLLGGSLEQRRGDLTQAEEEENKALANTDGSQSVQNNQSVKERDTEHKKTTEDDELDERTHQLKDKVKDRCKPGSELDNVSTTSTISRGSSRR